MPSRRGLAKLKNSRKWPTQNTSRELHPSCRRIKAELEHRPRRTRNLFKPCSRCCLQDTTLASTLKICKCQGRYEMKRRQTRSMRESGRRTETLGTNPATASSLSSSSALASSSWISTWENQSLQSKPKRDSNPCNILAPHSRWRQALWSAPAWGCSIACRPWTGKTIRLSWSSAICVSGSLLWRVRQPTFDTVKSNKISTSSSPLRKFWALFRLRHTSSPTYLSGDQNWTWDMASRLSTGTWATTTCKWANISEKYWNIF